HQIRDIATYKNNYFIQSYGAGLYHFREENSTFEFIKNYLDINGSSLFIDEHSSILYSLDTSIKSTVNITQHKIKENSLEKIFTKTLFIDLKEPNSVKQSKFYDNRIYITNKKSIYIFDQDINLLHQINGNKIVDFTVDDKHIIYIDKHKIKRLSLTKYKSN
ncbi:MAG: hypothetical protein U9N49_03000, partial [Campylobacterota bacterium]|nr:hypothetical protein [Campylobacterota bacterium]